MALRRYIVGKLAQLQVVEAPAELVATELVTTKLGTSITTNQGLYVWVRGHGFRVVRNRVVEFNSMFDGSRQYCRVLREDDEKELAEYDTAIKFAEHQLQSAREARNEFLQVAVTRSEVPTAKRKSEPTVKVGA